MKWLKHVLASAVLLGAVAEEGMSQEFQYLSSLDATSIAEEPVLPNSSAMLDRVSGFKAHDVSLNNALATLGERAGVTLAFSKQFLPEQRVTCDCGTLSVAETLDRLLHGTSLTYRSVGSHVIIEPAAVGDRAERTPLYAALQPGADNLTRSANRLRLIRPAPSLRRTRQGTITGQVLDAVTQQALGAAEVDLEELQQSALTQADGRYQLTDVPAGTYTLTARRLGYRATSEEVTVVSGETVEVNFSLPTEAVALDEVVVVGYGAQARETVSGSVSQITSTDITRTSATTTADALVGKIQGINTRMTTSGGGRSFFSGDPLDGRPGASTTLEIRNMGSPLFVIDGVPTDDAQQFNQLNSADIESISILKDASAAVYGFRAANGVVLVETKQGGVDQAPQITINANVGAEDFTRYHYQDMANAYEYRFSELDSQNNRNQPRSYTREELELWRTGAPGYESTDHYPLVVNNPNALRYQINSSVSGGSNNARYYLSLGHTHQDYVMRDNHFQRTNLQANLSTNLTDNLTVGTELRARHELHDNVAIPGDQDVVRTYLLGIHSSWPTEQPWVDMDTRTMINGNVRYLTRSVASFTREYNGWQEDLRRSITGNFWAEYELPFGTTLRGTYSHEFWDRGFDRHQYSFDAWFCDDIETQSNCVRGTGNPQRDRDQIKNTREVSFGQLQAMHDLALGAHTASGVLAVEFEGSEDFFTRNRALPPNNLSHLFSTVDIYDVSNDWGITRRASFVGRLNYDYDRKYLVEVLGRYDGSYLYAPDRRWGFFPGVSLGWRITEEDFMDGRLDFLDELKVRGSWGQTGREQGVQPWGFLGGATYGVGNGSVFDGTLSQGARPRGLPVTKLSWVTSTMQNIGVDFGMLDRRLSGEVDLFERKLTGLPAARTDVLLPVEVGYGLPNENLESERNVGFEAVIRWSDQIGDVSYSLAPNVTVARRQILDRYRPRYASSWDRYRSASEDRWAGVNWGYTVTGQFQSMEEVESHPVDIDGQGNRTLLPGDLIYQDANGDGVINGLDQRPIGYATNTTPIVSFGGSVGLGYRGVTLNVDVSGGTMYAHNRFAETKNMFQGGHNAQAYFMDRWHREDPFDPQSEWVPGRYPPFRQGRPTSSFRNTDTFWRTNVSYVRVRRIEVGYHIPDRLSSGFGMSGIRVHGSISNPFTFDNVKHYGMDPEVVQGTALNYPTVRIIDFGFSANVGGL